MVRVRALWCKARQSFDIDIYLYELLSPFSMRRGYFFVYEDRKNNHKRAMIMNFRNIKNAGKRMLGMDVELDHKTFIPDLMDRVHADKDGTLASRMYRQFTPASEVQFEKVPEKRPKSWAGDKIKKAIYQGRCAGTHVEGVIGGTFRLSAQERNIEKLGSDHVMY